MHPFWKRHLTWPVWLVTGLALASSGVLLGAGADDLDPAVWRAMVAMADIDVPALFENLIGDL